MLAGRHLGQEGGGAAGAAVGVHEGDDQPVHPHLGHHHGPVAAAQHARRSTELSMRVSCPLGFPAPSEDGRQAHGEG